MMLPDLKTERLELAPLGQVHSVGMLELWSDSQVCEYVGAVADLDGNAIALPARTASDSDKIIRFFEHYQALGEKCRWALVRSEDQQFLGIVGFNRLGDICELAYHLIPMSWGNGYMHEACAAAIAWAKASYPNCKIQAFIEAQNHASIRLANRLNFVRTENSRDGAERYTLD